MTSPERATPEPDADATTDELQADIERTRAALGETAQALTAKFDVKARATVAASDAKNRIVAKPVVPLAAAIAVAAAIVGVVLWRRRR